MPGRFFRPKSGRLQCTCEHLFQSPRCRGASSDGRCPLQQLGFAGVSIPSMPGRFFRRRQKDEVQLQPTSFNPLDAGALLQTGATSKGTCYAMRFQSPRCRGASSDSAVPSTHRVGKPVSIPSMPGRFFRPPAVASRSVAMTCGGEIAEVVVR